MIRLFAIICVCLTPELFSAQIAPKDSIEAAREAREVDSIMEVIYLDEVVVGKNPYGAASHREFLILQNRVYKVYPYAKIAAERLTLLDRNMDKLKTRKEKRKYFKLVENYIENEFEDKLKKLSRKQGQILVKLVYRQTGKTTFELIKDYKSGWKAFWANNTGKVFDIDIKRGYNPEVVNEDYLIETILQRAFATGRLQPQEPAFDIDLERLDREWEQRAKDEAAAKKQ